jgi:ribosomal protein S27AE
MLGIQKVHCPNCGSSAERHHLDSGKLIRTQCATCDYLMITCTITAKVIEAYAPGIAADRKIFSYAKR